MKYVIKNENFCGFHKNYRKCRKNVKKQNCSSLENIYNTLDDFLIEDEVFDLIVKTLSKMFEKRIVRFKKT